MDTPDPDLVARMMAESDQSNAAARDLAMVGVTFRKTLIDGGFSSQIADALASQHLQIVMSHIFKGLNDA